MKFKSKKTILKCVSTMMLLGMIASVNTQKAKAAFIETVMSRRGSQVSAAGTNNYWSVQYKDITFRNGYTVKEVPDGSTYHFTYTVFWYNYIYNTY